ncbi:hypothetical protein [Microvirus D_HF4_329]|nr:hypothetical protein [Microvirus D_HF4_329]
MAKPVYASTSLKRFQFLDEQGREIPDAQPVAVPAGFKRPETLQEQIQRLIRSDKLAQMASDQGMETFEESEDFDIDDDMFDPSSPYEEVFDPVLGRGITLDEFRKNEAMYQQRYLDAEEKAYQAYQVSNALRARPKSEDKKPSRAASERVSSESNDQENQDT